MVASGRYLVFSTCEKVFVSKFVTEQQNPDKIRISLARKVGDLALLVWQGEWEPKIMFNTGSWKA